MRVTDIAEIPFKTGGTGWKVSLEGTDKVLWLKQKPDFEKGHDLSESNLEVNQKGNYQLKGQPRQGGQPRPAKNDDDIMLQVALKAVVELERHHVVPQGDMKGVIARVSAETAELNAALHMMRPKAP